MDGIKSNASGFEYKLDEVNIAKLWNPNTMEPDKMGGFNFGTEDKILRWLHRGDTIYDVDIPEEAEVVQIEGATTIYRTNKIIIKNPRKVDDDLALHFYEISKIPEKVRKGAQHDLRSPQKCCDRRTRFPDPLRLPGDPQYIRGHERPGINRPGAGSCCAPDVLCGFRCH